MELDRYTSLTDKRHEVYEFLSSGSKGTTKKIVAYQHLQHNVFNLAFGDWNEETQKISDTIRSNNDDLQKVLGTVASTIFEFIKHHPGCIIYASGSTKARTRLYQIGINKHWKEISRQFEIEGLYANVWQSFRPGRNYEAFTLRAK